MSAVDYATRGRCAQQSVRSRRLAFLDRLVRSLPPTLPVSRAMASPPSITSGTSTAGGTLTRHFYTGTADSSWLIPSSPFGDQFAYSRTVIGKDGVGAFVAGSNAVANAILTAGVGATLGAAQFQTSFTHHGQLLELMIAQSSSWFMVRVDGQYVTLTPTSTGVAGGGATTFYKMDFGSRGFRRIDLIGNVITFRGVNVEPQDTVFAAPIRGPRVIVLGDSFSQPNANGWHAQFADIMGWDDVWAMGVGATGFIANNSGAAKTFGQRLASDVIAYAPDICIVLGGLNDTASSATAGTNAAALVAAFRSALPAALLIGAFNSTRGIDTLAYTALDTMDAIKAAFVNGGAQWLNPSELPLTYSGGTAASAALTVDHAAARAGNTGTQGTGSASTGFRCNSLVSSPVNLRVGSTVEVGSGATRERKVINGITNVNGSSVSYAFDGALQYAHVAGTLVREVGPSYLTGRGYVGATTGWGNADVLTSSDGTHPSTDGHTALGWAMAGLVRDRLHALYAAAAA